MTGRYMVLLPILFFAAGCVGMPPEWADFIGINEFECGMNAAEVEALSGRPVQEMATPRGWRTHFMRENETVVWLGFEDKKLRYLQTTWSVKKRTAQYAIEDICKGRHFQDYDSV